MDLLLLVYHDCNYQLMIDHPVCLQPCYERVKDWLNENLVALWIFAFCTALTQVNTAAMNPASDSEVLYVQYT